MTTAKSRRKAKLRRRIGRPPKPGPRGASGRLKTQHVANESAREKREMEAAVIETATVARLRQTGMYDAVERAEAENRALAEEHGHTGRPKWVDRKVAENKDMIARAKAEVRSPLYGCAVGRRLMADGKSELWEAVCHMRRTVIAYDRALGAPQRHAKCLRILLPVDKLEADSTTPAIDTRTPEDRQRQAVSAWMALQGWLGYTDAAARTACLRAVVDEPDEPISDWTGVVLALRCVAEGVRGVRVQARVRR